MTGTPSARRYLSLWWPFLPADRWQRERGEAADPRPLVFIEKVAGASRIAAVDARAGAQGLQPGMTLADARAQVPQLKAVARDHASEAAFLDQLADAASTFTPSLALDAPHGLVLDITGCTALFGGEAELVARLRRAVHAQGITVCRTAVAPTPDMARALARFDRIAVCIVDDNQAARALPVTALECGAEDTRALRRAGLKTIGDVADRPSVLFTSRFTAAFTTKLARVLGEEDRRITPRRPPPAYMIEQRCAEPITSTAAIERLVEHLAQAMSGQLLERGEGGRVFETAFFRTDGAVRRIRIETSQPTRDPKAIQRLYRDRLAALDDPLDPGFGFDLVRFQVLRAEPVVASQTTLDARDDQREQLSHLIDRLATIFGRERITTLRAVDTHVPERAQIAAPFKAQLSAGASATAWTKTGTAEARATRPLHLFQHPQVIDVTDAGDAAPTRFRWRRVVHQVTNAEGPERIADAWWDTPSGHGTRDYFRVATADGRRFWIFRAAATQPTPQPKWFLHGVFP